MAHEWEAVIGLEIHCQLNTKTKVWCGCSCDYDNSPVNTHTCPICLGHPGALPTLNKKVVDYAIKAGIALNCNINRESTFDRKNYFYPDTPKNYQITQFLHPYASDGYIDIKLSNGSSKKIGITRIHIEEDAGKSIHGGDCSYINFNRASIPLIEIVSKPDINSSGEAYTYLNIVRDALKYAKISDVSMEHGSLRCDANISVKHKDTVTLGTRVEVKNLNSFKGVSRAIDYEISRQIEDIENNKKINQETRLWDEELQITKIMRSKENHMDYRFFPEPDLGKIIISDTQLERLKSQMPESKILKELRFIKQYNISLIDIKILIESMELADYFEAVVSSCNNSKSSCSWILTEVLRILKNKNQSITNFSITAQELGEIIKLIDNGTISSKLAKELFKIKLNDTRTPHEIVKEQNMGQVIDHSDIEKMVIEVLKNNNKLINDYKIADEGKKPRVLKGLMGQIMKASKGKANPKLVMGLLLNKLLEK